MKEEEQQLAAPLDELPCLVARVEVDADGQREVLSVSGGLLEEMRFDRAALLANPAVFVEAIHPDDRHLLVEKRNRMRASGKSTAVQMRFEAKDKTYRWLKVKMSPVGLSSDRMIYDLIALDITDEVEARAREEELQRRQFENEKMDALGRLSGGVAHDFNNMLAIFSTTIDLAIQDIPKGHPVRHHLRDALRVCERGKHLINQILVLSREDQTPDHPVRLDHALKDAAAFLRRILPRNIDLIAEWPPQQAVVRANSTKLFQLLLNLCVNAQHAIGDKNGKIFIRLQQRPDAFNSCRPSSMGRAHYCLTVEDTGHGIEQELIDRIFTPFFTTKRAGQGTGLGLAVVQGIVEQADGWIEVSSQLGRGTIFDVYLPVCDQGIPKESIPRSKPKQGCGHVLLIEDELTLKALTTRLMERYGYSVTAVSSAEEAIDQVKTHPSNFNIVLSDFGLPGMDGVACARTIRSITNTVPILIYSGYADSEAILVAKREGTIKDSISKPFTTQELLDKLSALAA